MDTVVEKQVDIASKIAHILDRLLDGLYEREEAVRLALLSALSGESIFLLGPPGVGKSLIARRLKFAFKEGISFEYLMNKFSTPDEIFGPISIKKLKDEDKYERLTDRYLPGANIVFLDEIWKAGPAIQNALLTILNEKIYRNGEQDIKVNIRGIITASNELPGKEGNLAAIWDRFLVRLEMGNIKSMNNFIGMITDTENLYDDPVPDDLKLTNAELEQFTNEIDKITVGPEILNTLQLIKLKLDDYNQKIGIGGDQILIHDRRWKKIIKLMRASAFLNGRKKVDLMDCFLMKHCLWSRPTQKQKVAEILTESVEKHGYSLAVNLTALKKEIEAFEEDVESEIRVKNTVAKKELKPIYDEYFQLVKQEQKFNGALISINQYRSLKIDTPTVTNFFDENKNLVNRINAAKGKQEHTIEVFHASEIMIYELDTRFIETVEYIEKKPHSLLIKHWDDQYAKLNKFITDHIQHMNDNHPTELKTLRQNIFVDDQYVKVVEQNFSEVLNKLKQLKIRIEKIQFAYSN